MDSFFISNSEIFYLTILVFLLILPFKLFNKDNRLTFAHPLIFYSGIMIYYTVLCPFVQIIINDTTSKGYDFRNQYALGWQGAILSVFSVFIGYSLNTKFKKNITRKCSLNRNSLWSIGLLLNFIGISLFMVIKGFDISKFNPFTSQSLSITFLDYGGEFSNYFRYALEFLVGGNLLMFAVSYETRKKFILTLIISILTIFLFLNSGFRFRILFMIVSMLLFFFIREKKLKPNLAINLGSLSLVFVLFFFIYIGQIRTYGLGFDFDALNNSQDSFLQLMFKNAESDLFITTSGVMNVIPEKLPFLNFYPIFKTIIHPLPSFLFNKGSGDYLFSIVDAVYRFKDIYQGAAYLNYAEYYAMFGWFGIFIFSLLLGNLFKRLWQWINLHNEDPFALVIYLLNVTFIFMLISRGYLPQQVQLYCFTILPLYLVYFFNLRKVSNN